VATDHCTPRRLSSPSSPVVLGGGRQQVTHQPSSRHNRPRRRRASRPSLAYSCASSQARPCMVPSACRGRLRGSTRVDGERNTGQGVDGTRNTVHPWRPCRPSDEARAAPDRASTTSTTRLSSSAHPQGRRGRGVARAATAGVLRPSAATAVVVSPCLDSSPSSPDDAADRSAAAGRSAVRDPCTVARAVRLSDPCARGAGLLLNSGPRSVPLLLACCRGHGRRCDPLPGRRTADGTPCWGWTVFEIPSIPGVPGSCWIRNEQPRSSMDRKSASRSSSSSRGGAFLGRAGECPVPGCSSAIHCCLSQFHPRKQARTRRIFSILSKNCIDATNCCERN